MFTFNDAKLKFITIQAVISKDLRARHASLDDNELLIFFNFFLVLVQ